MKKVAVIALLIFAGFKGWERYQSNQSLDPLMEQPYVVVYGRDSCGFTQKTLDDLSSAGVNFRYFKIDEREVADSIHTRMEESRISTRRYNLPVVDVNGKISIRPSIDDVLAMYGQKL